MKVLWITNTVFPEAQSLLTGIDDFKSSGGWLLGASAQLSMTEGISLVVATMSKAVKKITYLQGKRIRYVIVPYYSNPLKSKMQVVWKEVQSHENPDLVHIHGTEHLFALSYIKACGSKNLVVSIQGLISEIAKFYLAGIDKRDIFLNYTIRDFFFSSILSEQRDFIRRGEFEISCLSLVSHVIGRTSFDHDHIKCINDRLIYHFCNETLRKEFYSGVWLYKDCRKYSIFLSQASYPIKGLHQLIKALPFVIKRYPNTKVFIAGFDLTCRNGSVLRKILIPGYGLYIRRLINRFGLKDVISFTGALDADEIKEQLLKANVFVCPSSIENSSNSLGEAQLLGVPCIASYVGGIPDMIPNDNCGLLYRFDDSEMLANRICDVFSNSYSFNNEEMRSLAHSRHDPEHNLNRLIEIYKMIAQQ